MLVANILGVDLGLVIGLGMICGLFAMIAAGPVWGGICGSKFDVPVPEQYQNAPEYDESKLPSLGSVVSIIMIPLFLILINSVLGMFPEGSAVDAVRPIFSFLGTPFIALLLATVVVMFLLGTKNGYSLKELEKVMTKSLEPTGLILLVTAGGGVLRYMLQDSGMGDIIGNAVAATPLPIVVVAFLIALAVRVSVGSATVAMTMAAGTVTTTAQIDEAIEAGAQFIVTPGFDAELVVYAQSKDIAIYPGCTTPTDYHQALNRLKLPAVSSYQVKIYYKFRIFSLFYIHGGL